VTAPAVPLKGPRAACAMSPVDEALAVTFFFVTLGLPWVLAGLAVYIGMYGTATGFACFILAMLLLAFHPLPTFTHHLRRSRLSLALARYFTMELLIDRGHPIIGLCGTPAVEADEFQKLHLPAVYLACPHGVFNYAAIVWCCFSRWLVGWEQYTGAASAVANVPGLRYLAPLIWLVSAERSSIVAALRERRDAASRRGGMIGMVPDGILGAFRGRVGVDELLIGKKRGLLRICTEEGATVFTAWCFGTTSMLTVLQDPCGLMETVSRKTKTAVMGYYGRWGMPIPRRVATTISVAATKATKIANPTAEQVEELHQQVYGALKTTYDLQKAAAGYPDQTLEVK